jgi:prevent-host-death family protein
MASEVTIRRTAAVARLKAKLSDYLARVKAGEEVVVTERGRPIARIIPLRAGRDAVEVRVQELARAGLARPGSGRLPDGFWKMPRPATRGAGLRALLEERRGGR